MKPNAYLLLVDDDPVLLRVTARALGAAGYFVEVAFSAAECRQLVRFRRPDLILLDVVLPDESGLEVCRWLKSGAETSGICVVLISSFQTTSGHQEAGLAAGADAYLVRPIGTSELVARIGALLRVQQAQVALQEAQASLARGNMGRTDDTKGTRPEVSSEAAVSTVLPGKVGTATELARVLARHFDELLTEISSHSSRVVEDPRLPSELRRYLGQISLALQRGNELALGLRHFCGQELCQPRVFELNEYLECFGPRLQSLLGERITTEFRLTPGLPQILADPGMVEQVFFHLVTNARDAMPDGGRLVIQTQAVEVSPSDASRNRGATPGTYACLAVTDTGQGMDAESQLRMFEAFFTTKPVGRGFGLGLATVQDVVRQHRGWTEVQSEPGKGSTVRIYFPAAQKDSV